MANPEQSQVERIKRTRELFDPEQTGIVVGTSGIALYLNGFEWPVKSVGDVDIVMPDRAAIALAKERLDGLGEIESAEFLTILDLGKQVTLRGQLNITPSDLDKYLPGQLFVSSVDRYYNMSVAKAYGMATELLGERTLPLSTLLEWKLRALRLKDKSDGVKLTEFAITNELVEPVAARSLRSVIENVRTSPFTNRKSYGASY